MCIYSYYDFLLREGGCGLPTAFHAIERTTLRMGDTVVIQVSLF